MPQNSQSRLDAAAKAKGFPSYAAWKAWNDKYRKPVTNNDAQPKKKKNFFQSLVERIPGHPAQTLSYTNDRMRKAMERRKKK